MAKRGSNTIEIRVNVGKGDITVSPGYAHFAVYEEITWSAPEASSLLIIFKDGTAVGFPPSLEEKGGERRASQAPPSARLRRRDRRGAGPRAEARYVRLPARARGGRQGLRGRELSRDHHPVERAVRAARARRPPVPGAPLRLRRRCAQGERRAERSTKRLRNRSPRRGAGGLWSAATTCDAGALHDSGSQRRTDAPEPFSPAPLRRSQAHGQSPGRSRGPLRTAAAPPRPGQSDATIQGPTRTTTRRGARADGPRRRRIAHEQ